MSFFIEFINNLNNQPFYMIKSNIIPASIPTEYKIPKIVKFSFLCLFTLNKIIKIGNNKFI